MTRVGHSINIAIAERGARARYLGSTEWRKGLFGKGNKSKEDCQDWAFKAFPELREFKKGEQGHRADAMMIAEAGRLLVENGTIEEETPGPLAGQND